MIAMTQDKSRRIFIALIGGVISLGALGEVEAQVPNLDQSVFIEGLAEGGYAELLDRLIVIEPPQDDITRLHTQIATRRLAFQDMRRRTRDILRGSPSHEDVERAQQLQRDSDVEYEQMLDRMRELGEVAQDAPLFPMWQVDYAAALLNEYLNQVNNSASGFYLFGVYTPEQAEIFSEASVEAFAVLSEADAGFFDRETTLPQQPEHQAQRVNTGLWERFINVYWHRQLPFFMAQAAYYVSQLPDSNPYYQQLGQFDARIRQQASTPADERRRLLNIVVERVDEFLENGGERIRQSRNFANTLKGLAMIQLGQEQDGVELLQQVLESTPEQVYTIWSGIGLARHSAQASDQGLAAARDRFKQLQDIAFVYTVPTNRLLVADAEHRMLMEELVEKAPNAQARAQALETAYEPYFALFSDDRLGTQGTSTRFAVYRRWSEQAQGQNLQQLPAAVRFGIGEIHYANAQRAYQRYQQSRQQNEAALEQAKEEFAKANEAFVTLFDDAIDDSVRAPAMYQSGMTIFIPNQQNLREIMRATQTWVELGKAVPNHNDSVRAMDTAIRLLTYFHSEDQTRDSVASQYREAMTVLKENFPNESITHDQLIYYGQVLRDDGQWARAAMVFNDVPSGRDDYFTAQLNRFDAMMELLRIVSVAREAEENGGEQDTLVEQASFGRAVMEDGPDWARGNEAALVREILESASQLEEQVQNALAQNPGATSPRQALGASILARAEVARVQGEYQQELELVDGFEQEFAGDDYLVASALQRQILALIHMERYDQAGNVAQDMMRQYPNAAAGVVAEVLRAIEREVTRLNEAAARDNVEIRAQRLREQARAVGAQAQPLGEALVAWASERGFDENEMITYELLQAKGLRLAGNSDRAAELMRRILQRVPNDPQVITEAAEALFQAGDPDSLRESQRLFSTLIRNYQNQRPLPSLYWNAWMRWLEAAALLGHTDEIALQVGRLKMQGDENLGGSPYREVMERLAEQYQPR